jgi:hypothetical protein
MGSSAIDSHYPALELDGIIGSYPGAIDDGGSMRTRVLSFETLHTRARQLSKILAVYIIGRVTLLVVLVL